MASSVHGAVVWVCVSDMVVSFLCITLWSVVVRAKGKVYGCDKARP